MALTPEKKVKDKIVKVLKEEGVYYFFPATHSVLCERVLLGH
jgi:hypothetical protein